MEKNFRAFTLLELLLTLVILGVALSPFSKIIWYGKRSFINIKDEVIAQNLVKEKIEELKLLRYDKIVSDFAVYGIIYRGTRHEEFIDMDNNVELFENNFSDIFTPSLKKKYPLIYSNFKKVYRKYIGLPYQLYPEEYKDFRRLTIVEEKKNYQKTGINVKIIKISIFSKQRNKQLVSYTFMRTEDGR